MTDNKDNAALRKRPVQPEVRTAIQKQDKSRLVYEELQNDLELQTLHRKKIELYSSLYPKSALTNDDIFQFADHPAIKKVDERIELRIKQIKDYYDK